VFHRHHDGAEDHGKDKQRDFFSDDDFFPEGMFFFGIVFFSVKGPVIDQQKQKRKSHDARVGQHGTDKGRQKQKIENPGCGKGCGPGVLNIGQKADRNKKKIEGGVMKSQPGHCFHVDGVYGKQAGYQGARPESLSHFGKTHKKQQGAGDMQKKVDKVTRTGVFPEKPGIKGAYKEGYRFPKAGKMDRFDKYPFQVWQGQPVLKNVGGNFLLIVHYAVVTSLAIYGDIKQDQAQADKYNAFTCHKRAQLLTRPAYIVFVS